MAAVGSDEPTPQGLAEASAELGREIAKLRAEVNRAAELAGMRDDPALPLIRVLTTSLDAQWRLHNQAVRYFGSTSDRLDRQYQETMAQAEAALDAKRVTLVESLAPKLAETVRESVRRGHRVNDVKTAVVSGCFAVAVALGVGMACYAMGWKAEYQAVLNDKAVIEKSMQQQGPDSQAALAEMASKNNLGHAWAKCQSDVVPMKDGGRACRVLLWVDPPPERDPKGAGS